MQQTSAASEPVARGARGASIVMQIENRVIGKYLNFLFIIRQLYILHLALYDFWCEVLGCAAKCPRPVRDLLGEAEVRDLEMSLLPTKCQMLIRDTTATG